MTTKLDQDSELDGYYLDATKSYIRKLVEDAARKAATRGDNLITEEDIRVARRNRPVPSTGFSVDGEDEAHRRFATATPVETAESKNDEEESSSIDAAPRVA